MVASRAYSYWLRVVGGVLFASMALAHGCGNDESRGSGGATATCADACARCPTPDVCADCSGYNARFRDEFEGPLYGCVVRAGDGGCPRDWEVCVTEGIGAAGERDMDRSFRSACLARRTECQNQGAGFADDPCLSSAAFIESLVTQAQQCLPKACNEISACIHDAFEGPKVR